MDVLRMMYETDLEAKPMEDQIAWLEYEISRTEKQIEKAQLRLDSLRVVLDLAIRKHKKEMESASPRKSKAKTLTDMIKDVLEDKGPSKASVILKELEALGRETTVNSINVSLNRFRPQVFDRDDDGRWMVVPEDTEE
jgi:predicted  nucleic acid-binding Zn-ribbon protein